MPKQILIKAAGTIHISNTLTLVQRQSWNHLLRVAFPDLGKTETHKIHVKELQELMGTRTKNIEELKKSLKTLVKTEIEWNIFGKDRTAKWGVTTALAGIEIANGVCEYSFSPQLQKFMRSPSIYARLNLTVQRGIKSRYTQVLWEYMTAALDSTKQRGMSTEWVDWSEYLKLFGIEKLTQPNKYYSQRYVSKPLKELNLITDLNAAAEYKRESRKIVQVRFIVHKKNQLALPFDDELASEVGINVTSPETNSATAMELHRRGVSTIAAERLVREHGESKVLFQIDHWDYLESIGKRPNSPGWLVEAIESSETPLGYKPPVGYKTQEEILLENRKTNLVSEARKLLHFGEWDKAIEMAEQRIGISPNEEMVQIIRDAKIRKKEEETRTIVSEYEKDMTDTDREVIEHLTILKILESSKPMQQDYKRQGKNSVTYKLAYEQIILEKAKAKESQAGSSG